MYYSYYIILVCVTIFVSVVVGKCMFIEAFSQLQFLASCQKISVNWHVLIFLIFLLDYLYDNSGRRSRIRRSSLKKIALAESKLNCKFRMTCFSNIVFESKLYKCNEYCLCSLGVFTGKWWQNGKIHIFMSSSTLTVDTKLQLWRTHAAHTALGQLVRITHYAHLSTFIEYVVNLK